MANIDDFPLKAENSNWKNPIFPNLWLLQRKNDQIAFFFVKLLFFLIYLWIFFKVQSWTEWLSSFLPFSIFSKIPKNDTFAKNRCSRTIFGGFLGKNNKRETGKQFPLFPYLQQEFSCFPGSRETNRETGKQKFGTLL